MSAETVLAGLRSLLSDPIISVGLPLFFTTVVPLLIWGIRCHARRFTPKELDILALAHHYGHDFISRTTTFESPDQVCAGTVILADPSDPSTRHAYLVAFDRLKARGAIRQGSGPNTWRLHGLGLRKAMELPRPRQRDFLWTDSRHLDA